ncbi:hypothetical protein DDB_G0278879 [Dictyostelium discoideum AX4]|uniref:Probable serine/threonine-protein kinase gdt9 n=1 Tax=Dictyostelium discoideum TaxID=44689 RepID=GDT9_DICDI|nr:hypothetical protein DDB_G0278879 [Dictyostelium discoideum AX4]Q5VJL3.2 RecName: Full=Probable serine/threonine-protein kinase gdt9; AltName: Full=Growth-differentiation transition protein 9; AltName: Full=Protein kinase Dusty; Flags: Precursor [Dictyostelium discoideum]EAS66889.1 hypothetical protein DDB_G0278879 [Dictyostelium discoideum AX4]|eukprot:XP_001134573.1 hypothetical protein DDB_G0278879 [Dictyostelium discoideum AX4]
MKTFLLIFLLICVCKGITNITTPSIYFDLKKINRFQDYLNNGITPSINLTFHDFYYPDVCVNTIKNIDGSTNFVKSSFLNAPTNFANLYITKGSKMTVKPNQILGAFINILCIEGSLEVPVGVFPFFIGALVILPGGNFKSESSFRFMNLVNSKIDPLNFFPGILTLGGSLSILGPKSIKYSANRLGDFQFQLLELIDPNSFNSDYKANIYSESFVTGQQCDFVSITNGYTLTVGGCQGVPSTDVNIYIFFATVDYDCTFIDSDSEVPASIYISGDTNVHIENFFLNSLGKTTNANYNDTILIFSPTDDTNVTDIIIGTNQRYRNSLFVEFSNNVTLRNNFIRESIESRSPLMFFASSPILEGNLVVSNSGSSVIAQFGTEFIQSTNNSYFLEPPTQPVIPNDNNMDYGTEGNGIYSLSPIVSFTTDVFVGQLISINFNFIANRSLVTGFNYDCFAPCYPGSPIISNLVQHSVDFNIIKPTFSYSHGNTTSSTTTSSTTTNTNSHFLLNVNDNGNEPSSYYSFNQLSIASEAIKVNLPIGTLGIGNLFATNNFKIDGALERLDILNSIFNLPPPISNNFSQSGILLSTTTSMLNSYVFVSIGSEPTRIESQIYGSTITPYYYNNIETLDLFQIQSIFPSVQYQIIKNSTINITINITTTTTTTTTPTTNNVVCSFTSIVNQQSSVTNEISINETLIQMDPILNNCVFPLSIDQEGSLKLRVTIKNQNSTLENQYYYIIDFPEITIFQSFQFYTGIKFIDVQSSSSSSQQTSSFSPTTTTFLNLLSTTENSNGFLNGCQISNQCTLSNNVKYVSSLPNVTNSPDFQLFQSGITPIIPYDPVVINLGIEKNKTFQFQLFFTFYQPIDQYSSPLSIFIQSEPYLLLDPLIDAPNFKNFTFFYDNLNQDSIEISFISRGDIYLTSMAIYSLDLVSYESSDSSSSSSNSSSSTGNGIGDIVNNEDNHKKLVIALSVSIPVAALLVILCFGIFICYNNNKKNKNETKGKDIETNTDKKDDENENENCKFQFKDEFLTNPNEINIQLKKLMINKSSTLPPQSTISIDTSPSSENTTFTESLTPKKSATVNGEIDFSRNSTNESTVSNSSSENNSDNNNNNNNKCKKEKLSSFPTIPGTNLTNIPLNLVGRKSRNPEDKYRTNNDILVCLQESHYFKPDDPSIPIEFSESVLDFGRGSKCLIDETYIYTISVKNKSTTDYNILLILPIDNNTGTISTDTQYFQINAGESKPISFSISLNCTTKYFEKIGVSIEELNYHTFICVHMESELSTRLDFSELDFDEICGQGTYGMVYKGKWRSQVVAIKMMRVGTVNCDEVYREMDIMGKIRHQNVISFIGCVVSLEHLCIVTEFSPIGSLGDLIHGDNNQKKSNTNTITNTITNTNTNTNTSTSTSTKLTVKQKLRIAIDIARGCQFLHQCGIIHRDLKPDNVLVFDINHNAPVCAKISDFGTSKETNEFSNKNTNCVGTPIYMSNEILEKKTYDNSTDVYSFAVLFYEMMIEEVPFSEIDEKWEIPSKVISGWRPTKGLNSLDRDIKNLINICWAPHSLPSFDEIVFSLVKIFKRFN